MSNNLKVALIVVGAFLIVSVLTLVAKKKLPIKYSLFWLAAAFVILLVGAVPKFIGIFTKAIGFETSSSLVTGIIVGLLLYCIPPTRNFITNFFPIFKIFQ